MEPFVLSLMLASITTLCLTLLCVPFAWWLCFGQSRSRYWIEPLTNLPLVIPPTVLGFYLLLAFGLDGSLGQFLDRYLGIRLVFSFEGLVFGSILFSLPFMMQPLLSSFRQVPTNLINAARTFGHSEWTILWRVILPLAKPGLLAGFILSFAHTIGEFGVVLMVGGNIPGETRTVSIAIYNEVDRGNYTHAHWYSLALIVFAFITLLAMRWFQSKVEAQR